MGFSQFHRRCIIPDQRNHFSANNGTKTAKNGQKK